MAEEVKIVDVAGGPAAEATLQELLKVVKSISAKRGGTGGESAATQALFTKAVSEGTKATKAKSIALNAGAKTVNVFAKGLGAATGLLKGALGAAVGVVGNFASALANASNMGELLEAVPIFGSVLGKASGYFQKGADTFQQLSEVGAGFGQNLFELRNAAAQSGLTLEQFASVIGNNSTAIGLLGATTSEGAKRFGRVTKQLRSSEAGLLALGYSIEGLNEGTAAYIELQAAAGQLRNKSDKELTEGAKNYLTEIDLLSKVTGKSRKEIQDGMNDRMQAANANVLASRLEDKERTRFLANLSHTESMLGKGMSDVMTDLGDGVAQSDFARVLASSVPGLQDLAEANATGKISQEEYQRRLQALMPQITKFADGMGAAGVSQLQNKAGFGEFMDSVAKARTYTERLASAQAAAAEQARREPITQFMSNFGQTIQNIRSTIENALIDSGVMETLGTMLKEVGEVVIELAKDLTNSFASFIKTDNVKKSVSSFKEYILEMGVKAREFIGYFKTEEFKEKFESFKDGIIKAKDAVVGFVKDISEFGFGGAIAKMLSGGTTTELSTAIGGMVGKALIGLGGALISGIGSLFTSPTALAALVAAIGTLFVLGKAKSAIGDMIGGGSKSSTPTAPGPGGKAGANAGGMLGGLAGGVVEGVGNGLAGVGAKAPLVIAGAAAIGAAIGLIGAGIAGATFLLGKSLPTLSEGLKSFEQLDGGKLIESGKGMAAIAVGMAAFGAGSAVAGLGSLVGSISQGIAGLFGADDPMVKLQKFAEYNINGARVKNNAEALVAFSSAMATSGGASAVSGIGSVTSAVGSAIAGFFGSNSGLPYDQILKFASYDFDVNKIKNNATAMAAFNTALTSSAGAQAASGGGGAIAAIGGAISRFFGADTPFDQVKAFGDLQLNADGVKNNATAMTAMYTALGSMSGAGAIKDVEIPKALVARIKELSQITGGGLPVVAAGMEAIGKVQGLQTNLDILKNGLDVQGVTSYTTAMGKLVTTLDDLNKVLAKDNKGIFGSGTGVAAADVVKKGGLGGGASEEQLQKLDLLNTTMVQVLATLQEGNEYGRRTSKAIRANGNLQMGV